MVRLLFFLNFYEDVIVFKVEKISCEFMCIGEVFLNVGRFESSFNVVEVCFCFGLNGGCYESVGSEVEIRLFVCYDEVIVERDFGSVRNVD